ncbi:stage II sporulation protein R [Thermaerobacter marianensis]|nr:stage II sporulation protein R [Thermaerobacter marianensis]
MDEPGAPATAGPSAQATATGQGWNGPATQEPAGPGRWLKMMAWLALAIGVAALLGPRVAGYAPAVEPAVAAVDATEGAAGAAEPAPPVVRLHIIANSDSAQDQALKLQVRDALVPILVDAVAGARTPEEALARAARIAGRLEDRARAVVRQAGYGYGVRVETGTFAFDRRRLGDAVYPAGTYAAVRVVLGTGQGHNFWCVLFPGLCGLGDAGPAAGAAGNPAGTVTGGTVPGDAVAGAGAQPKAGGAVTVAAAGGAAPDAGPPAGAGAAGAGAGAAHGAAGTAGSADGTAWQGATPQPRWFFLEWWRASVGRWWASLAWSPRAAAAR